MYHNLASIVELFNSRTKYWCHSSCDGILLQWHSQSLFPTEYGKTENAHRLAKAQMYTWICSGDWFMSKDAIGTYWSALDNSSSPFPIINWANVSVWCTLLQMGWQSSHSFLKMSESGNPVTLVTRDISLDAVVSSSLIHALWKNLNTIYFQQFAVPKTFPISVLTVGKVS